MAEKRSQANQALGRAIRELRRERGVSQEGFAPLAGLERSNYGAIERGEFNVTVDTLVKIARAPRLPLAALFKRARL
jgi:DNA-binding XRE family transcriptional regulator